MVTIGAFAIALLALAVIVYNEFNHYGEGNLQNLAQMSGSPEHLRIPRKNTVGFVAKCKAIAQFAYVVFFMSEDSKQEQVRRNELTAQTLLKEYQDFITRDPEERTRRFLRWRDDIAHFDSNQQASLMVKSKTVEFRVS
ncbi:MAG: hypothetical protein MJK04_24035 [Psychrosphaera sp.]|nr:hypothetical protein [Psychrosphaera sp.]